MSDKLMKAWIGAQIRVHNFWENFKSEEKGAAEIVAIILVIVIVIALVAIFKDRIKAVIENTFNLVDQSVSNTNAVQ